jgi:glutamate 5-kinase
MVHREKLKAKKKIVVKIGTSLLTYDDGKMNLDRIEKLVRVLADLQNSGKEVILVSSGAVGVGVGILGLDKKPESLDRKQALAAIGQVGLIRLYQNYFEAHNINVAQILLTRDGIEHSKRRDNARNTFSALVEMGIMPIVNENDTVATEEIEFGDNDTLSAVVAILTDADLLLILTNTDGIFTSDPHTDEFAMKVSKVIDISTDLKDVDLQGASKMGSGGMITKVAAAEMCREHNVDVIIADGGDPMHIMDILEGKDIGTFFVCEATSGESS